MNIGAGLVLVFLAGTLMGGNLVPLKWIRTWGWENFWFVYSIVSLLVVPCVLAFALIPHLTAVYAGAPRSALARPFLYGMLWGVAQLGAGICVDKIGLALTGAILNGLSSAFGTLTPLIAQHSNMLGSSSGILLIAGTGVMLAGVVLCGWAGYRREEILTGTTPGRRAGRAYFLVMLLAIVSGVLAALLNIALAFGGDIVQGARAQGAAPAWAVFAVWPLALAGGLILNLAYSIYLMNRNHSWGNFAARPKEIVHPVLGGSLWMLAIAIYSSGTVFLGILGVSVGWALFQITMILVATLAGIWTHEWRSIERRIFHVNVGGVALLFGAIVMMAVANYSVH